MYVFLNTHSLPEFEDYHLLNLFSFFQELKIKTQARENKNHYQKKLTLIVIIFHVYFPEVFDSSARIDERTYLS